MLKSASCPSCKSFLPLGPGGWKIRFPPYHLKCPQCGITLKTDFFYRATWTSNIFFKTVFYISIPILGWGYFQGIAEGEAAKKWLGTCAIAWLFFLFLAYIASFLAYLPIQCVLEAIMAFFPNKKSIEGQDILSTKK